MGKKELEAWIYVALAAILIAAIATLFFKYPFLASLRAVFGLIYVLFLPGYVIARLFFKDIDWIEKAALSLGLSIALVILSVMFSNMLLKIPITPLTNFFVILSVMIITILVKTYQKQVILSLNKFRFWQKNKSRKK